MKIILNHNNLYFCSGPCNILSPEYSIVDYNNNYLFELKPYDGNRYPKITYRLPNKDTLEIINCRICAECHKTSLDLMEVIDVFDGLDDIEDLKGFEEDIKNLTKGVNEEYTGLYVIKKFILLECCTEEAKEYIKNV